MILTDFKGIQLRLRGEDNGKTSVFDPIRKKWVILTPEEHVRQYLIQYLAANKLYPAGMMSVEKGIDVGGMEKRYDIVVYDRNHKPWMLGECKAPEIDITEKTLFQLLTYHNVLQCRYWLLSNGRQTFCADASNPDQVVWLNSLPTYQP